MSESKTRSSRKILKRRVANSLGKETGGADQHSSPRSPSTTREYVPNLPENLSLWDSDRAKALKDAVELVKAAAASDVDQSFKDKTENMNLIERLEEMMILYAQMTPGFIFICGNFEKLAEEAAESRVKISKLTQDLKEVQSEVDLGKINLKIAEKLVEQAKQEKHLVELKSTRKIQELETELQQLKDKFKNAPSDGKVDV